MAYGIYAQMRSPGSRSTRSANEAFADEYSMNFWKGRFYVRVAGFEHGEARTRRCSVRESDRGGDTEGGLRSPRKRRLPQEGLVPTISAISRRASSGGRSSRAFMGTYKVGSEAGKLYLATLVDSAAARERSSGTRTRWNRFSRRRKARKANTSSASERIPTRGMFSFSPSGDILAFSRGSRILRGGD